MAFSADRPNEKRCGDITCVKIWDGWVCVFTRRGREVDAWVGRQGQRTWDGVT